MDIAKSLFNLLDIFVRSLAIRPTGCIPFFRSQVYICKSLPNEAARFMTFACPCLLPKLCIGAVIRPLAVPHRRVGYRPL
jgi:hypothetical protein